WTARSRQHSVLDLASIPGQQKRAARLSVPGERQARQAAIAERGRIARDESEQERRGFSGKLLMSSWPGSSRPSRLGGQGTPRSGIRGSSPRRTPERFDELRTLYRLPSHFAGAAPDAGADRDARDCNWGDAGR